VSPRLDLDAYVEQISADPFEVEWKDKTYTVAEPPWVNLQVFARKMDADEEFTDEDIRGFLRIFFGSEQFEAMAKDGLADSHSAMFKLFLEAGKFAVSRVPEEARDPKALAALQGVTPANGSASPSKGARKTSGSSRRRSNGTSG
jgi:hypothetical protein